MTSSRADRGAGRLTGGLRIYLTITSSRAGSRVGVLTAAVVLALAVSGCLPGAGEQLPPPDWQNPAGGIPVASATAAQRQVQFRIHLMPGRPPSRILLIGLDSAAPAVVVLQYGTSFGLVDVFEQKAQLTVRQFRHVIDWWVGRNNNPGTSGTAASVRLRGKYQALMTTTADGSRSAISWIEAGVKYLIEGPAVDQQDCVRLARQLAS
jgi:hypothetical protein